MDVLDLAILGLRIALVGVLYGFLVVVLRSAGRWLDTPRSAESAGSSSSRPGLRLVVLDAGDSGLTPGQTIEVSDEATLGRAERAEVVVADAAVSAEHARVRRSGKNWVVVDLGSTNGTLVNNSRVNGQTLLHDGDLLVLGGVRLKIGLGSSSRDEG
ncbi:MAG: FHA domain-containing protein [Chloroflexota bacterium]